MFYERGWYYDSAEILESVRSLCFEHPCNGRLPLPSVSQDNKVCHSAGVELMLVCCYSQLSEPHLILDRIDLYAVILGSELRSMQAPNAYFVSFLLLNGLFERAVTLAVQAVINRFSDKPEEIKGRTHTRYSALRSLKVTQISVSYDIRQFRVQHPDICEAWSFSPN